MSQSCREFQDRWLERIVPVDAADDRLSAHMAGCAECTAFVLRNERMQNALAMLDRLEVPDELPGRVVAACHAGYLQERAASALGAIGRVEPPSELDRKVLGDELADVDDSGRLHAPKVLERLVHEELHDPPKALSRRFARRLERLEAPAELERRVLEELARGEKVATAPGRRVVWGIGVASAAFVVVLGLSIWLAARVASPREPELVFRVEHVRSAAELDPAARELIGALSGGWAGLRWEPPR